MHEALISSPWPGVLAVAFLYSSDYVLTLICARLYATRAKQKIVIEGSYELNPLFQKHVDSGRWFSLRWLIGVGVLCLLFYLLWWLSAGIGRPGPYVFVLGGMVFCQMAIHARHFRNLFVFTTALGEDGIRGRIEYPRRVVLAMSAFEFLVFSAIFAVAYLLTDSVALLGGAACCLLVAAKHYLLRWRLKGHGTAKEAPEPGPSASSDIE